MLQGTMFDGFRVVFSSVRNFLWATFRVWRSLDGHFYTEMNPQILLTVVWNLLNLIMTITRKDVWTCI